MSDDLFVSGASFILDAPEGIPARWGIRDEVIWARDESLIITGPPGVGKTSLWAQIVLSMIGVNGSHVLGYPVEPASKVLYLAADRPSQIARVFRRLVGEEHRALLDARLVILRGPPDEDLGRHPTRLRDLARQAQADVVIVDSLKDVTSGLTDDDIGAGINRAFQLVLTDNIDLGISHHQRKSGSLGSKPKNLEDVYGSAFITAGAGSVILLWGKPGDEIITFDHLKTPATQVGPFTIEHDHDAGTSMVQAGSDLLGILVLNGGCSIDQIARLMYATDTPTPAERKRVERMLKGHEKAGRVLHVPRERQPNGTYIPAKYFLQAMDITMDKGSVADNHGQPRTGGTGKVLPFNGLTMDGTMDAP